MPQKATLSTKIGAIMRIPCTPLRNWTSIFLSLLFLAVSTEAMAQSGGPAGGGGGFGQGPSGAPRGGQPGAYRMQRVYGSSMSDPAGRAGSASQPGSQSPERPSTETGPESSQPSLQLRQQQAISREKRRQRSASPEKRYESYRSITEKYEKLREDRHKEYWNKQK